MFIQLYTIYQGIPLPFIFTLCREDAENVWPSPHDMRSPTGFTNTTKVYSVEGPKPSLPVEVFLEKPKFGGEIAACFDVTDFFMFQDVSIFNHI